MGVKEKRHPLSRALCMALTLVLATTSVVDGTFAKYVTVGRGADNARVAKWGVKVNISDDMGLFKTSYNTRNNTELSSVKVDVSSSANDNVVAPGTEGNMTFSISGVPEVATKVSMKVTGKDGAAAPQVICLPAGTYTLPAGQFADAECSVTITEDYEPIKWYFGQNAIDDETVYSNTLSQLQSNASLAKEFIPNTDFSAVGNSWYLGWKWIFQDQAVGGTWNYKGGRSAPFDGATIADFLDTYLGNESSLQTEAFTLNVAVEQIEDYTDPATATPTPTASAQPNPTTTYTVKLGDGQIITKGNTGKVESNADYSKFQSVKVDGSTVAPGNYVTYEGSTGIEFKVDYIKSLAVGTHSFEIISTDGSAKGTFEVKDAPPVPTVDSVGVVGEPDKKAYTAGENFVPTGISIKAQPTGDDITGDIVWNQPLKAGDTTATGTYTDGNGNKHTVTVPNITVNPRPEDVVKLKNLTLTGASTKSYSAGQAFDPESIKVTANYTDGSSADVSSSITWSPSPLTTGVTAVTGTYTDPTTGDQKTVTVKLTNPVTAAKISNVEVKGSATNEPFADGQTFKPAGVTVTANKEDGSKENITNKVSWNKIKKGDVQATGTYTDPATGKPISITVPLTKAVTDPVVEKIEPSGKSNKQYVAGQTFDGEGVTLTATKSDGTTTTIPATAVSWDPLSKDAIKATGRYTDPISGDKIPVTVELNKPVSDSAVSIITPSGKSNKQYAAGQTPNPDDVTLTVTDTTGNSHTIPTSDVAWDKATQDAQKVTGKYTDPVTGDKISVEVELTNPVSAPVVEKIEPSGKSNKQYAAGQTFDGEGITLTATKSDGTTTTIPATAVSWDPLTKDAIKATGRYTDPISGDKIPVTVELNKPVSDSAVSTITPSGKSNKQYAAGQTPNPDDVTLTVTDTSGNSHTIPTSDVAWDKATQDAQKVTGKYTDPVTGDKISVEVNLTNPVTAPVVEKIEPSGKSNKQYAAGQTFDGEGVTLTATKSDGTTTTIPATAVSWDPLTKDAIKATGTYEDPVSHAKIPVTVELNKAVSDMIVTIEAISDQDYTGSEVKPTLTVKVNGTPIGTDSYDAVYSSNINPGTANVAVTLKGAYSGTKSTTFKIIATVGDGSGNTLLEVANVTDRTYTGSEIKPEPTVKFNGNTLTKGTDFDYEYESNTNVTNAAKVKVKCKGNYSGTATKTFNIVAKPLSAADISISSIGNQTYSGNEIKPTVSVTVNGNVLGTDSYDIEYSSNTNPGTGTVKVKLKGNYSGEKSETFKIIAQIADASNNPVSALTIAAVDDQKYDNGNEIKPTPEVKFNGTKLEAGTDFEYEYSDNKEASTSDKLAVIKVVGMGNYSGTAKTTFKIVKPSLADLIKDIGGTALDDKTILNNNGGAGIQWGYYGTSLGLTSHTGGKTITDTILKRTDIPSNSIWSYCKQVREKTGDKSWYVPAIDELEALYPSGFDETAMGCTDLWSSTEYDSYRAYNRYYNGYTNYNNSKDATSGSGWCYGVVLVRASS